MTMIGVGISPCLNSKIVAPAPVGDQTIGSLYNTSSWANLNDFTVSGMTPSVSGAGIALSGGNGDFGQYMMFDETSNDENQTMSVTVQVTDKSAGAYGIGIGRRRGQYTWGLDLLVQVDFVASEMNLWWNDSGNNLLHTVSLATIATNDNITVTFAQAGPIFTATFLNNTTLATSTYSITCNMAAVKNYRIPNTTRPCVWNFGGGCTIKNLTVTSASISNPDFLFIGDSKTVGFSVDGSIYLRFADQFKGTGSVTVMAGDGEETAGIVTDLPYITGHIQPCTVILSIGSNDIRGGVSSGTWQANLNNIVSTLKTAGFTVVHLLPIPENSLDQSALKSYIQSTYSGDNQVDPSTGWVADKHISSDGVHPSSTGHYHIASKLIASGYLPTWVARSSKLLEAYIGCRAWFGFRKVSDLYTGNCLKVRRSSDNTTLAIGFVSNEVDTAAITTFIAGSNGFIDTLYDQSGNGDDWVPGSTGAQPQIATSGSLITVGGKLVALWDGSNDKAIISAYLSGEVSAYAVVANHRTVIAGSIDLIFTTKGAGVNDPGIAFQTSNTFVSATQRQLIADLPSGTTATTYKNGSTTPLTLNLDEMCVASIHTSTSQTSSGIVLGNYPADDFAANIYLRELVIWPYLSGTSMRNAVHASQGADNGITVA